MKDKRFGVLYFHNYILNGDIECLHFTYKPKSVNDY